VPNPRTFVIIGAGQAGGWAARTLRDQGFDGRIMLVGAETHPPHERPPLSKSVLLGDKPPEVTHLFPPETYGQLAIELHLGTRATGLDPAAKRITLGTGATIDFDRLLLAMGGRARPLPVAGADLAGVHLLRTIEDSLAIRAELQPGRRLLVAGGGWIGLEVAAAARKRGAEVVLVEALDRLCARAVTPDISAYLLDLHRGHGVDVRLARGLIRFDGAGRVERATLSDGSTIDIDAAVIGIGLVPNTELAQAAGLAVDNGIVVDGFGRTVHPDIFAAGDLANQPSGWLGRRIRLESWENAQNQAILVAHAMLDRPMLDRAERPYDEVPWFWSDQYGINLQLLGLPQSWDSIVERSQRDSPPYLVFYLRGGRIEGAVGINAGRDMRFVRRLMTAGQPVAAAALANPATKIQDLLRAVAAP
jgi:3-phenylpropionate/trans-cinnamate dioxygenase ferredoxin reductase subunit